MVSTYRRRAGLSAAAPRRDLRTRPCEELKTCLLDIFVVECPQSNSIHESSLPGVYIYIYEWSSHDLSFRRSIPGVYKAR